RTALRDRPGKGMRGRHGARSPRAATAGARASAAGGRLNHMYTPHKSETSGFNNANRSDWFTTLVIRHLPQPMDTAFRRWCYPALVMARDRVVRLTRMRGATRTGQASVLIGGPDPWAFDLARRFFRGWPQESAAGEAPIWKLDSVLQNLAPTV